MSKSVSEKTSGFVTLNHFEDGLSGDKYVTGVSDINPKSGFIHIDRYEYIRGGKNEDYLPIHRLVAVAEYGIKAVEDKVVHHKNGVRFDNRPNNLELMTNADHIQHEQRKESLDEKLESRNDKEVKKALRKAGYNDAADSIGVVD